MFDVNELGESALGEARRVCDKWYSLRKMLQNAGKHAALLKTTVEAGFLQFLTPFLSF